MQRGVRVCRWGRRLDCASTVIPLNFSASSAGVLCVLCG
jgi:hypothetical protein